MRIKELGHVVLYVYELKRSADFYRDTLGFPEIMRGQGVALFSSGRTHHELLLIEVGGAPLPKQHSRLGLYHIGFKIGDTPEDARQAFRKLKEKGVKIVGTSDHTITHSIYILDPDGNELELYADVSDAWKRNPRLIMASIKPLDLDL